MNETYIEELLSQLTLEEKVSMVHGAGLFRTAPVERLGIPGLHFSDGPMGVRAEMMDNEWRPACTTEDMVSYLPSNSAIASTWNRELAKKAGSVLGEEARGRGKDMILAPGINIKRTPFCGRNFEYMSEDPYLTAQMVVPVVEGVQSHDVSACVKHFAANAQETERLWVDTIVDERTLQEIYYPGFRAAVEQGNAWGLMGAYNKLNGEHCCTGKHLLNEVLREQWGFDGLVVSDWGGVHDTVEAAQSGLDVEMDVHYQFNKHYLADPLLEKIRAGELPEDILDDKIRNILRLMLRLKMIGPERETRKKGCYNTPEHRRSALEVAQESIILLKNEENVLPLNAQKCRRIAVIGGNAPAIHSNGGGSAEIKALYEISPLLGMKMLLGGNTVVEYAPGYDLPPLGSRPEISWQADSTKHQEEDPRLRRQVSGENAQRLINEAVELAKRCDAVIFVGGLNHDYDTEGLDRNDMKLPYGQDAVVEALLSARPDTVVVLYGGSPVEMPWADRAKAIVWSYYAGMEGGTALAQVLFGEVNPSGKLAETFPCKGEDCKAEFGGKERVTFSEGVMVGYRYYDTEKIPVNFCFGHGLSYTSFQYADMAVTRGEDGWTVTAQVTNTGSLPGKETVQLYVAPETAGPLVRPSHQLRGFQKVSLVPGETKTVTFSLSAMDFACYLEEKGAFSPMRGRYTLEVGASSRDIRLTHPLTV